MLPSNKFVLWCLRDKIRTKGCFSTWRIASILAVGVLCVSAFFAAIFIYKNIYTTIANTNAIVILQSSLNVDAVDSEAFEKAVNFVEQKKEKTPWDHNTRYPFEYVTTTITPIR